ncbi:MAG: oligosaccharide flippase family protein [Gemmatimonadetes bacterium]|nr:oligosaccharide flippase family protein [Gemmatimonadota bacterium]
MTAPDTGIVGRVRAMLTGGTLRLSATLGLLVTLGSIATGMAVQVTLTHVLGNDGYGAYSFAFGCVNIAGILAKFDLDTVSTRFGGTYGAQGSWGRLRTLARTLLLWAFLVSAGLSALGYLLLIPAARILSVDTVRVLRAALLIIPPTAVLMISAALLQSQGRTVAAQLPQAIVRSLVFLVIMLVLGGVLGTISPEAAVLSNVAGTGIALAVSLVLLTRAIPGHDAVKATVAERAQWRETAQGALLVSVGQIILSTQMDVVLLGLFTTKRNSGFYSVASQLATLTMLGPTAIMTVVGPRVAALHAAGDVKGLQHLVDRARHGALLFTVPLLALLVVAGPLILRLFGPDFPAGSYPPLVILALASVIHPLLGTMGGFLLTLTGHHDQAARIVWLAAATYLALAFVLGPRWGPEGIATSTLVAYAIRAAVLRHYAKKNIGVDLLGAS